MNTDTRDNRGIRDTRDTRDNHDNHVSRNNRDIVNERLQNIPGLQSYSGMPINNMNYINEPTLDKMLPQFEPGDINSRLNNRGMVPRNTPLKNNGYIPVFENLPVGTRDLNKKNLD